MLKNLENELKLRGFSEQTYKAYVSINNRFLKYVSKTPEEITTDDIKSYLSFLISEKKQKPASISLNLSALKFFYEDILKRKDLFLDIKSPKSEKKLPTVLTKEEIKKLLESIKNNKHKLLVQLMYSSGLRVSEVVKIKIEDLDFSEKLGRVISGKGKKDRYIILSSSLIEKIKEYLDLREDENPYLFPSNNSHITIRMAQKIVSEAAKKAGIKKRVFCHALRSSFATHLLESGTDIRIIQTLLGHSNLSTTERYTKVSTEQIKKVKSPLDDL